MRSKKRFYTIPFPDPDDYATICQSTVFRDAFTWKRDWSTGEIMFDKCHGRELAEHLQKVIDAGETSWFEILGFPELTNQVTHDR